jgi:uncharacterized protein
MALAALLVLLCGVAVGATSIGGVLVVPVLTSMADVATERAVAASSLGFAFTGAAAWATRPSGSAAGHGWALGGGALVGAALGALTLAWLPGSAVRLAVGLLAIGSGVFALSGARPLRSREGPLGGQRAQRVWWQAIGRGRHASLAAGSGGAALLVLGAVVGCASAWSGTGGPVVLLPLLALLGWPALHAVEAAQRVQLPVAVSATAMNALAGRLDVVLGLVIGVLVLAGWAAGRALGQRLPVRRLQQTLAVALIVAGLFYL